MKSSEEIARRNDAVRKRIPIIPKPDVLVMTRGIAALPADEVAKIYGESTRVRCLRRRYRKAG